MAYNNEWGKEGEEIAAEYLISKGYTIRERNWRSGKNKRRELDLIAQIDDIIAFVEVKSRKPETTDPVEAVTLEKMRRMARSADTYLSREEHEYQYRFDIISIVGTPQAYTVEHIPDAFLSPLF